MPISRNTCPATSVHGQSLSWLAKQIGQKDTATPPQSNVQLSAPQVVESNRPSHSLHRGTCLAVSFDVLPAAERQHHSVPRRQGDGVSTRGFSCDAVVDHCVGRERLC